jgi:hypothetical protein
VPRSCQPLRTASSSSTLDATWRHLLCGAGRQPVLLADTCQLCIPPVILGEHQRLPHHSKPLGEAQCCLPYARADSQQAGAWLQSRKACVQARKPPTDYSTGCACHIPTVLYPQTQPAYAPPPPLPVSPGTRHATSGVKYIQPLWWQLLMGSKAMASVPRGWGAAGARQQGQATGLPCAHSVADLQGQAGQQRLVVSRWPPTVMLYMHLLMEH